MNHDKKRITLIQPPIRDFYFTAKRSIPYGLASIAASLRLGGFDVSLVDSLATSKSRKLSIPCEMQYLNDFYGRGDVSPFALFNGYKHYGFSIEKTARKAAETGAFLFGISSLFTAYSSMTIETALAIKKIMPDALIVTGGHHATAMPGHMLECPAIDFVIRGEGESAMTMLAEAILGKIPFDEVPGLVWKDACGTVRMNERAVVARLDDIPLPAIDLVDHKFYSRGGGGSSVITSSRGCPMKCSYCCVGSANIKWRKRRPEDILSEIRMAVENHSVRFIDFEDENLSLDSIWFNEILDVVIENFEGLELRAMNGLFPPSLSFELMCKMRKAGFRTLNLSVGSTSAAQLKRFGRTPAVAECLDTVLSDADTAGLESVCYIIASAPGQSSESSVDDLVYFASRKTLVGISVYYPAPGSIDYSILETNKMLPQSFSLMRSSAMPLASPDSRVETATVMRLGRILNFIKAVIKTDADSVRAVNPAESRIDVSDRLQSGINLLNAFFYDRKIRGLEKSGLVYEHKVSEKLCELFVSGISFML